MPEAHRRAAAIVSAARAQIGTPFRAQGRAGTGLDCLGLVLRVCADAGIRVAPIAARPLRGWGAADASRGLRAAGCKRLAVDAVRPGDLLMAEPGLRHVHLAICTPDGVVEAHAGLGAVVARPRRAGEAWHSGWRLPEGGD